MPVLSKTLPLAACALIVYSNSGKPSVASGLAAPEPRRTFLNRAATATTGATMGWVLTQQQHQADCLCGQCRNSQQHSAGCNCGMCTGQHDAGCQCGQCASEQQHDSNCNCGMCLTAHDVGCNCGVCGPSLGFRPSAANAFEKREIGGEGRSAETAAFNIQNQKTYERLEKSGFPLDTRAEEQARLNDALSSFSYPSNTSSKNKKNKDKK